MSVNLYTPDSNVIVHETKVDFRRRVVQRQVNLVQYDKSMPVIAVKLCSNGNDYVLPETASAYIRFGKRDHTYVYNGCLGCDQTRTIVYFAITDQMTIFYGEHTPIVELRIGDTVAGSGSIPIWIDRNPIQNGDTESKSDLSVFEKAIEAAQKIDAKLPTDLGASATNLHLLTGDTKLGGGINLNGFEYDEVTKTLKAKGGSSPCLNLMDFTADPPTVRTTITEEEKTNLENGLYNSVLYSDLSSPTAELSVYFPEFLSGLGYEIFTTFNISVDETTDTHSIVGMSGYQMQFGEKGSDGNYPITITKTLNATFGGGGGGNSLTLKLSDISTGEQKTSLTEEEKTNLETGKYGFVSYYDESWGDAAETMLMFPQLLGCIHGTYFALIYNVSVSNDVPSISGFLVYSIEIGEKNSDGTYPLTIEKAIEVPFGGGGGAIQEIEAIKSTEADAEANQYTLSSTPTSSMFIMKVKNDNGAYSRFTMILQSFGTSTELYFGCKIVSFFDTNTCVYAYSAGNIAILTNQCYLPPEIKDGDVGKVLVAGGNGYRLEKLPSSLPNISQSDIGKYLVVDNNQKASWQNLPESTSTIIRRW